MFRHRSAIFKESTNTKKPKSNTPLQVLITLIVFFKILKYESSKAHKDDLYTPTLLCHQKHVIMSPFQYKLAAIYVLLSWQTYAYKLQRITEMAASLYWKGLIITCFW